MLSILYIIFMIALFFGLTIFIHELGHFIAARRCGLIVETFSVGFGPAIFQKESNGIVYKIGVIPFGGYVALPQLEPGDSDKEESESDSDKEDLPDVVAWKKIIVALSGPVGNILFAIVLAWVVFLNSESQLKAGSPVIGEIETDSLVYSAGLRSGDEIIAVKGNPVFSWYDVKVEGLLGSAETNRIPLTVLQSGKSTNQIPVTINDPSEGGALIDGVRPAVPCLVGRVKPDASADRAGIQAGDVIRSFDGVSINDWTQFTGLVDEQAGKPTPIELERDGTNLLLEVTPEYDPELERALIGIELGGTSSMPWMQYHQPWQQLKHDASAIFRILKALATPSESGQAAKGLGGPVMIFAMIFKILQTGLLNTIGLIRFININLAVLNLLPIPVLDGGHILFALWETITRRKVNPKFAATLVNIFATLLIGAMLFISVRDISKLWDWHTATKQEEQATLATTNDPPASAEQTPE